MERISENGISKVSERARNRCFRLSRRIGPWGERIDPWIEISFTVFSCIERVPGLETGRPGAALVEAPLLEATMRAVLAKTRVPKVPAS